MKILEVVANTEFLLFVLGFLGNDLFMVVHKIIVRCNPKMFSAICVILTFILVKSIKQS